MTKLLRGVPNLGPLYAKAATGVFGGKRSKSTELKTPAVAVRGAKVSAGRDQSFRELAGAPKSADAFFGHIHALIMPMQMELMSADDFPLPMMGLIHTENTYRQFAPVPVGSEVDIEVRVDGFRAHRAGTEVVLKATVTAADAGGAESAAGDAPAVLVEEESVYLAKGRRLKDVGEAPEQQARPRFKPPVPTAQWRLPGSIGRSWAKVSGDWNPIHVTGVTAKALGMPGVVAHGMYTASRALAESDVPEGAPFEFHISFAAPVIVPKTVQVAITRAGEVEGGTARGGMDIVAWDGRKKRPHFTGTVRDL